MHYYADKIRYIDIMSLINLGICHIQVGKADKKVLIINLFIREAVYINITIAVDGDTHCAPNTCQIILINYHCC